MYYGACFRKSSERYEWAANILPNDINGKVNILANNRLHLYYNLHHIEYDNIKIESFQRLLTISTENN